MNAQDRWARLLGVVGGRRTPLAAPMSTPMSMSMSEALELSADIGPDVVGASVTEMVGPNFRTPATSGATPLELDLAQYAAGAGPCLAAARDRQPQQVDDLGADTRYPQFNAAGLAIGVRSSLSLPMVGTFRPAAVNFYAAEPQTFVDARTHAAAALLTRCLSVLSGGHPPGAGAADRGDAGVQARSAGDAVRRAITTIMNRENCDQHAAYRQLIELARRENRHVAAVAQDWLAGSGLEGAR